MITHKERAYQGCQSFSGIIISLTNVEEQDTVSSRGLMSQRKWWMILELQKRRRFIRRTSKREWR